VVRTPRTRLPSWPRQCLTSSHRRPCRDSAQIQAWLPELEPHCPARLRRGHREGRSSPSWPGCGSNRGQQVPFAGPQRAHQAKGTSGAPLRLAFAVTVTDRFPECARIAVGANSPTLTSSSPMSRNLCHEASQPNLQLSSRARTTRWSEARLSPLVGCEGREGDFRQTQWQPSSSLQWGSPTTSVAPNKRQRLPCSRGCQFQDPGLPRDRTIEPG
jgi:hypothetical protein